MNLTNIHLSKFEKLRNRRLPLEKQAQWFTEEYKRATKNTDYEYLAGTLRCTVREWGRTIFEGTSELAGLEIGSRPS